MNTIFERISAALAAGDRVEIRGFGTFSVREQRGRESRNLRTGTRVDVPAKSLLHFKPGKEMRARLNPQDVSIDGST